MGQLRDRMEQDLKLKSVSPATIRNYLLYCRKFLRDARRSRAAGVLGHLRESTISHTTAVVDVTGHLNHVRRGGIISRRPAPRGGCVIGSHHVLRTLPKGSYTVRLIVPVAERTRVRQPRGVS